MRGLGQVSFTDGYDKTYSNPAVLECPDGPKWTMVNSAKEPLTINIPISVSLSPNHRSICLSFSRLHGILRYGDLLTPVSLTGLDVDIHALTTSANGIARA